MKVILIVEEEDGRELRMRENDVIEQLGVEKQEGEET